MGEYRELSKKELKALRPGTTLLADYGDAFFVTRSGIFGQHGSVYSHKEWLHGGYEVRVVYTPET